MTLERPAFQEGMALNAAVFRAEQSSRIERLLRHGRRGHLPGIVSGLELSISADQIRVTPGVILMPSGRVLCLSELRSLDAPSGNGQHAVLVRERVLAGRRGLAVTPELSLEAERAEDAICLGTVIQSDGTLSLDLADRQLTGAVGDRITSPDGHVTLSLGLNEHRAQPELALSFADQDPVLTLSAVRGALVRDRFSIHPGTGDPTALTTPSVQFPSHSPPPEAAAPWSLRRVQVEIDDQIFDELRLELHHPGKSGDPARSRIAIGTFDDAQPDAPEFTGIAMDAVGETTLFDGGEAASTGINVVPPGRVAFSPVTPGPTDSAFAAALTEAMLQGLTWALLIATLNSGITGVVLDGTDPVAGVTVTLGERTTVTDTTGRFFLAAAGWPGETVLLSFADDDDLGTQAAIVRAGLQVFNVEISGNNGDII